MHNPCLKPRPIDKPSSAYYCNDYFLFSFFFFLATEDLYISSLLQEDFPLLFQEKSVAMNWHTNVMANYHGRTCFCPVSSWQEKDSLLGKALHQP